MKSIKKLVRRGTEPAFTLSEIPEKSQQALKMRRKSEGILKIPESIIETAPKPMPKYYFQGLDRDGAEAILKDEPAGTFLVRDRQSSNTPGCYTLSIRDKDDTYRHYRIETNPRNKKLVLQTYQDSQFDSLEGLMDFFIKNQNNSNGILKPYIAGSPRSTSKSDGDIYMKMDENNIHDTYIQMGNAPAAVKRPNYTVDGRRRSSSSPYPPPTPTFPSNQECYENVNTGGHRPLSAEPPKHSNRVNENFRKISAQNERPYSSEQSNTAYENVPAHKGDSPTPTSPKSSAPPLPPKSPTQNYENLPSKMSSLQVEPNTGPRGGHRVPPPPSPTYETPTSYENLPIKRRTLPHQKSVQNDVYENCPGRDDPPLPPRRQPPMTGTGNRKISLPQSYEGLLSNQGGPPPVPARPHGNAYENIPRQGMSRPPMLRAQTSPEARF